MQAEGAELSTVAVCAETMSHVGPQKLYEDIVNGKFRQVIVSPEIVVSESFRKEVLSKKKFHQQLRAVCVDEAHCISLWGGSFRSDYAGLGVLRRRFPSNVPFVVASATLPEHILDDIKRKLRLSTSVQKVSVSNARPNVALSVRAMQHSEESKGDLRFLIPKDAKEANDIPITLVYCNQSRTPTTQAALLC
jgi:superfamily II DNA helicase RecQ